MRERPLQRIQAQKFRQIHSRPIGFSLVYAANMAAA
jgi:hypothetical protein